MTAADHTAYVRRLWTTWASRGVDAMLELVPDDVEYRLLQTGGEPLAGSAELRRWLESLEALDQAPDAEAYAYERVGSCVLVTGFLRRRTATGISDSQPAWIYEFEDDTLRRVTAFPSATDARAAAEAICADGAQHLPAV